MAEISIELDIQIRFGSEQMAENLVDSEHDQYFHSPQTMQFGIA